VKSNLRKPSHYKQLNSKGDGKVSSHCNCKASTQSNIKEKNVKFINDCTRCGRSHEMNNCPAYSKICKQCGLKNHFKNKCRKKEVSVVKGQGQINNIETDNMCVN